MILESLYLRCGKRCLNKFLWIIIGKYEIIVVEELGGLMTDIHTIIAGHRGGKVHPGAQDYEVNEGNQYEPPTTSEIPDVFFDQILIEFKLSRVEINVLMYLYRRVWCKPNLYRKHGLSQLQSHFDMCRMLSISLEEIYQSLRNLENYGFIETIRSGQYFVRKYFTKDFDESFGQSYDDFEI